MYIPPFLLLLLCVILWQYSRDEARRAKEAAAAHTPHARYMDMLAAWRRENAAFLPQPIPTPPPQDPVWGHGKPWKTEAQYRNAVLVAQQEKALRLRRPAA